MIRPWYRLLFEAGWVGQGHKSFTWVEPCLEMDIVSHDVKKFFGLLLRKNGYVLEQLCSALVHTAPEHAEWKEIVAG